MRKRNNTKHCRVRTEGRNGGVISVLEHADYYTVCRSRIPLCLPSFLSPVVPPLVILSNDQCSFKTIFDPLTFWLFGDPPPPPPPPTLLCDAHIQMPNAQYVVHERKEVSMSRIPRCKCGSFFLKDQTDKIVVRTPLMRC